MVTITIYNNYHQYHDRHDHDDPSIFELAVSTQAQLVNKYHPKILFQSL